MVFSAARSSSKLVASIVRDQLVIQLQEREGASKASGRHSAFEGVVGAQNIGNDIHSRRAYLCCEKGNVCAKQ